MKFSKYNMVVERKNDLVIYNSKNAQFVKFNKEPELSRIKELLNTEDLSLEDNIVKALYERKYIVDDNFDEYAEIKNWVDNYYEKEAKKLELLIYVTEHCNFRCIYCPQSHMPKTLPSEKWDSLYSYIEKSIKADKYSEIELSYFGGEPLLESKKIINFLEKINILKQEYPNVKFVNHYTTNGYLLTPELYDRLVELGANFFQITLDGFAESHNVTRPRVDGQGTWDKIVENLKYINSKDDNVIVALRANYNKNNIDTMESFYEWCNKTFTNKKIQLASHPVTEFSEIVDPNLLASKEEMEYMEKLDSKNLNLNNERPENQILFKLGYTCRSAKLSHFSLSADAKLYRCNHTFDNCAGIIGFLDDDGNFVFEDNYEEWNSGFETKDCPECFMYPLCAGRCCPIKKIYESDTRPDCEDLKKTQEEIYKNILDGIYCA